MSGRCIITLALLAASTLATADPAAVYEATTEVWIGRVFLAPGDRERLDEQRLNQPAERAAEQPEDAGTATRPRALAAAGYIISSSGRARVWRDGDFIRSEGRAPTEIVFPGDIKVVRTVTEEPAVTTDKEQDQRERHAEADNDAD